MRRAPAFAREVIARRRRGERIGLLVVSVDDWNAGRWFDGREEVARVVVTDDLEPQSIRFDCVGALDVLLCGQALDERFHAVADAVFAHAPASLWGEYEDGIWRIERMRSGWVAVEGPFPHQWLARALHTHRTWCLMRGHGVYAAPAFSAARQAAFEAVFGDEAASAMRELFRARLADACGIREAA